MIEYNIGIKFTGKMTKKILKAMKWWKEGNDRLLDKYIADRLNLK